MQVFCVDCSVGPTSRGELRVSSYGLVLDLKAVHTAGMIVIVAVKELTSKFL